MAMSGELLADISGVSIGNAAQRLKQEAFIIEQCFAVTHSRMRLRLSKLQKETQLIGEGLATEVPDKTSMHCASEGV
jgi:hypothetical protein